MYHTKGGCVAPVDVGLVVGSGHIYIDVIHAFHDVSACYTPYRLKSVGLYLDLSGNIEQHPLGKYILQSKNTLFELHLLIILPELF